MMVMDACFILGFLIEVYMFVEKNPHSGIPFQFLTIAHDLLLLENQIPFFFLNEIFQCTVLEFVSITLPKLALPVLSWYNLFKADLKIDNVSVSNTHHILSLLHQCYAPPLDNEKKSFISSKYRSALDLDRAGVNFKPSKDPTPRKDKDPTPTKDPTWVMEMKVKRDRFPFSFWSWSKPTLTMPILNVDDGTEFLLRNLIAYEQLFQTQCYVSSYATTMDMLVNTEEDVAKLVESEVLYNVMGSNKEVADMINSLCKNVGTDSFYEKEWEKLNKYCNSYWPKHIAMMKSIYFSSPWRIIALVAGIILFVLQVAQTIYTIKSS